jgi:glycosyltransferase involved in cell wall biosynthesis
VRILFDYRPALRHRTGVGEFAHGLATTLQSALGPGDSLALFSSSWKDRLAPGAVPGAGRVDARIPVRVLNYAWHRLEWPPCEWFAGDVDIAHAQHPLLIPTRGSAARFITIHDLFFLDHPEQTSAEIRRDYASLVGSHARRAAGVVVSSGYTRDRVVDRLGVDPARITVCPAGAPEWPRRDEPPSGGPILYLGTVEPRKNLPGLLEAYARLVTSWPGAPRLVVAGRMAAPVESLISPRAAALLGSRVRFAGYVSDPEKQRLYHEALMLVIPSLDEGFGLPALEAMTLGIPVVASRRGSLPEVLGDAAVYIDPDDPASIAMAIRAVASDQALRTRLAEQGVRRARQFRWPAGAANVLQAYRDALARGRTR